MSCDSVAWLSECVTIHDASSGGGDLLHIGSMRVIEASDLSDFSLSLEHEVSHLLGLVDDDLSAEDRQVASSIDDLDQIFMNLLLAAGRTQYR